MPTELEAGTINSLGSKLEGFAEGLSEEERQALGGVLVRAEQAGEAEVGGFEFRQANAMNFGQVNVAKLEPGISSQLGNSLGGPTFDHAATISVSWSW